MSKYTQEQLRAMAQAALKKRDSPLFAERLARFARHLSVSNADAVRLIKAIAQ